MKQEFRPLCSALSEDEVLIRENVPFSALTSFRTGGNASLCLSPKSVDAFCRVLHLIDGEFPWRLLGRGTNVLAPDEGYDGILLLTDQLNALKIDGELLYAEAGVLLNSASLAAQKASLTGLEFAYGIPGSVGGGLCMNAGAYEHSLSELKLSITACDKRGNRVTLREKDCEYGYRKSIFLEKGYLALACEMTLKSGDAAAIRAQMEEYLNRRKNSQPLEYPSAGSFFKRPAGHFAGKLIQDAGLKGLRVGGAQVSEKHAGFIINAECATSSDVKALAELVQTKVKEQFGVTLEREVQYL